jgi:quinol-cytochrome oxidoreductase complex cytochrome b subunit
MDRIITPPWYILLCYNIYPQGLSGRELFITLSVLMVS